MTNSARSDSAGPKQTPVETVLSRLPGHRRSGAGWSAKCPAHDDQNPSLSVTGGEDGRVLLKCHSGCSVQSICTAIDLSVADLFSSAASSAVETHARIMETYDYRDEGGQLLFQVVRYQPKKFKQRRPGEKGGWIWSVKGVRRVLYRLPELLQSSIDTWAFVVEGEKDADRLISSGFLATTNSGGAGKWHLTDSTPLHGRRVCVVPDNDAAGRQHTDAIVRSLCDRAAEIRVIAPQNLPEKGDISDWLDAGNTAEQLVELISNAPAAAQTMTSEPPVTKTHRAILVSAASIQPRKPEWLWKNRVPLRKITSISGAPDVGKSTLALYIAARVSVGGAWTDLPGETNPTGGVVIISAEDDAEDTLVPRLIAAGADLKRINIFDATEMVSGEGTLTRAFTLGKLAPLEDAIRRTLGCRLVIIDPASAYLGSADSHNNAEVRSLLAPLGKTAAELNVAIILINHFRKGSGGSAINRTMGSLAFVAAPRAAWVCVVDRENADRRLFLRQKLNIANQPTGLAYRLVPSEADPEIPVLAWDPAPITMTADEALEEDSRDKGGVRVSEAMRWLQDLLSNGPLLSPIVEGAARKANIKWRTIQRAKARLNIQSRKQPEGWEWFMPTIENKQDCHQERQTSENGALGGVGTVEAGSKVSKARKNKGRSTSKRPAT